jgi:GNAT superfamily N-acetyltransferase
MDPLFANIVWHTLNGPHERFSAGDARARRYAPGFSPIAGFPDPARPDFAALASVTAVGDHLYFAGWRGRAPEGWRIQSDAPALRLVWDAAMPDAGASPSDATPLGREHADQALALATLTRPGPFGPRTIELGDYLGVFEGPRLVAMAGERMHAGTLREVSGVCTHPDRQGRGLARKLMLELIRRQLARGETPFLHVMRDNTIAVRLYERMGFRIIDEVDVRVVERS